VTFAPAMRGSAIAPVHAAFVGIDRHCGDDGPASVEFQHPRRVRSPALRGTVA
jgi:hypothetical protein